LAIHHEHRARDLDAAERYASGLAHVGTGRERLDTERRLARLRRKRERLGDGSLRYEGDRNDRDHS
jgi:hypothetical protein